jgi:hypothetical protein
MRLLDRLIADGFSVEDLYWAARNESLRELLMTAQLVVIDNVVDYFVQETWRKIEAKDHYDLSDFPCVMLPFEVAFLDMRFAPSDPVRRHFDIREAGLLLQMFTNQELASGKLGILALTDSEKTLLPQEGGSYYLVIHFFWSAGKVAQYGGNMTMPICDSGAIASRDGRVPGIGEFTGNLIGGRDKTRLEVLVQQLVCPAFLALSFMHCRNVRVTEETPQPKLSKIHQKKTGKPLLRYRILEIDHIKEVLEQQGHANTEGLKRALHICRGHFSSYGKDGRGLLFGKYVTTVWVPMHLRGDQNQGVVVKDYDVK